QYREWYLRKRHQVAPSGYKPTMGFIALSRALFTRGALAWELKLRRTKDFESRWKRSPRSFRDDVDEYLRIQGLRNLAAASMKVFRLDLISFGQFLAENGLDHHQLTYHQGLAWFEKLKGDGFAP